MTDEATQGPPQEESVPASPINSKPSRWSPSAPTGGRTGADRRSISGLRGVHRGNVVGL